MEIKLQSWHGKFRKQSGSLTPSILLLHYSQPQLQFMSEMTAQVSIIKSVFQIAGKKKGGRKGTSL